MAKKTRNGTTQASRRDTLDEMRRRQRSGERRKTALIVGGAGVVGVLLVGGTAFALWQERENDPARQALSSFGVAADAASCDEPVTEPATGVSQHVPDGTTVTYSQTPPAFGEHYAVPATFERGFYTPDDVPRVETLVHNLEHGYTVVWYDPDIPEDERDALQGLSDSVRENLSQEVAGNKFIVAPWDTSRGAMPEGKRYVLAHWGAEQGTRQLCGELSGSVVQEFVEAHPYTDSPEPNAA